MRALLLTAHGSRRAQSNEEVVALAQRLAEHAGERFGVVGPAFLELAEPSIPDAIDQAVAKGATEVVVLPYFLSAGRHVAADIPGLVEGRIAAHPQVDIRIAPYLGSADGVADLLLTLV